LHLSRVPSRNIQIIAIAQDFTPTTILNSSATLRTKTARGLSVHGHFVAPKLGFARALQI
jgi:hypothetical protein